MNDYYEKSYLPFIVKIGRIILILSLFIFFVPFLVTWLVMGIQPNWPILLRIGGAWFAMNFIFWIIEPLSYFPILGIPGTFISFLSGNGSNMRIPCAVASQKATGTLPGTKEGQLIATIGICISVYVNLVILTIGVLAGQAALSALPPIVTDILNYLLPALYGCVFAQFLEGSEVEGAAAFFLAIGILLIYDGGLLSWIPFDTSFLPLILPIFGTMAIAYFRSEKAQKKLTSQKNENS